MQIESIEPIKNKRNKITLDDNTSFYLYDSEIKKLGLSEGVELDEGLYNTIYEEFLYARAKKKALAILERSMNTKKQLTEKLKRNYFGEDVINKVVKLLEDYNLIDDYAYAKAYIESNKVKKSMRVLQFDLELKGIDRNIIKELIEDIDQTEIELEGIKKIVKRYMDAQGNIPEEKKGKIKSSLYRKGYKMDNINKVID